MSQVVNIGSLESFLARVVAASELNPMISEDSIGRQIVYSYPGHIDEEQKAFMQRHGFAVVAVLENVNLYAISKAPLKWVAGVRPAFVKAVDAGKPVNEKEAGEAAKLSDLLTVLDNGEVSPEHVTGLYQSRKPERFTEALGKYGLMWQWHDEDDDIVIVSTKMPKQGAPDGKKPRQVMIDEIADYPEHTYLKIETLLKNLDRGDEIDHTFRVRVYCDKMTSQFGRALASHGLGYEGSIYDNVYEVFVLPEDDPEHTAFGAV